MKEITALVFRSRDLDNKVPEVMKLYKTHRLYPISDTGYILAAPMAEIGIYSQSALIDREFKDI